MNYRKKIFLGLSNTAGINSRLKEGFDKLGVKADFYHFRDHPFSYNTGIKIKYSNNGFIRKIQKLALIIKLLIKYHYFIFLSPNPLLTNFYDIKIFMFFRKKMMLIFVGCDARIPEKVTKYKWNPCINCNQEYKDFVGCIIQEKKEIIKQVESLFDIIVCPQEASGFLKRTYVAAYFPINLESYILPEKYKVLNSKIKILHAPSNKGVKGTKYIYETIDRLKRNYDFEFELVSNVTVQKVYESILSSDIIIDQMLVGFYGLFSIEAMALSKPVICYIRDDIWENIKNDCPIYNANPDNLFEVLENILKNPERLKEAGMLSRLYVEKYHDAKKIASQYYQLFQNLKN
jgi:hypothetical protein